MTPIILKQKVRKRKKHKKTSLLRSPLLQKRVGVQHISFRMPKIKGLSQLWGRITSYIQKINWKSPLVITGTAGVLVFMALIAIAVGIGWTRDIPLHEDPVLQKSLLNVVSSEFDGQGSGEIADIDIKFISAVDPVTYVIQSGDTLSEIAREYDITVGTLIGYNGIENVRRIIPGEVLKIPEIDGIPYTVKAGDTLETIAETYNTSVNQLLDANDLSTNLIKPGDDLFIPGGQISEYEYRKATGTLFLYPVNGRLTSYYGYRSDPFTGRRRFHYGIDIANRTGTPVTATMAGVVADVGERPTGYGKYVILRHNYGFQSLYAHLDKVIVRKGQWVQQGGEIGEMGNTGRSTGPHLHFSIYKNNSPINPLNYLF
jgi:murein DD-endopeptidase MepM/ murein hydrolase activator NlpD